MDKALHALAGVLIFAASDLLDLPGSVSMAIVLLASAAKELADHASSNGQVEALDILSTLAGGLIAYIAAAAYRLTLPN